MMSILQELSYFSIIYPFSFNSSANFRLAKFPPRAPESRKAWSLLSFGSFSALSFILFPFRLSCEGNGISISIRSKFKEILDKYFKMRAHELQLSPSLSEGCSLFLLLVFPRKTLPLAYSRLYSAELSQSVFLQSLLWPSTSSLTQGHVFWSTLGSCLVEL